MSKVTFIFKGKTIVVDGKTTEKSLHSILCNSDDTIKNLEVDCIYVRHEQAVMEEKKLKLIPTSNNLVSKQVNLDGERYFLLVERKRGQNY